MSVKRPTTLAGVCVSSPGLRRCSAGKRMLPPPPRTWDVVSRIITHHHHHYHHHHPPPSPAPAQCQFQARPLSRTTAATIRGRSTRADVSNTITTTADQTILPPQRTQSVLLVDEKAPRSVMAASPETRSLAQGLTGLKVPTAPWATAVSSRRNVFRHLPQAIAHRGDKASWPENSMSSFKSAVEVGAHAIETDVRLSADGVVVLSHDPSLKRCFGVDKNVGDCPWEYLSTLKTVREPPQSMPRLSELLEWLASGGPELDKIWVLLDIKIENGAEDLISAVAATIAKAPASPSVPWNKRIVLGCWNATFIKAALSMMPGFPLAHISFSTIYSRHFLPIPNLGFNMLQRFLVGPWGSWFLRDAKQAGRPIFAWTVNEEKWMEWCIKKNIPPFLHGSTAGSKASLPPSSSSSFSSKPESATEPMNRGEDRTHVLIDGVITDNPKLFLDVCERVEDELDGSALSLTRPRPAGAFDGVKVTVGTVLELLLLQMVGAGVYLIRRFGQKRFDVFQDVQALK